jgi:carboxypeptidase family protein
MAARWIALAFWVSSLKPAFADPDEQHITGFITVAHGDLSGQVTDEDGKPVPGAKVHLATPSGNDRVVVADGQGKFKTPLPGDDGHTLVYVQGAARLTGHAAVPTETGGTEVVEIHEVIRPSVLPKPLTNPLRVLEYSDKAIDKNVWVRAWLLLEVDDKGSVARLKLLNKPGFDLDPIAIREGLKLKFEPARDRIGRPTSTLLLWKWEWPSYWFMTKFHAPMTTMPDVSWVPCRGTAPMKQDYRDCTQPNMAGAMALPWIDAKR